MKKAFYISFLLIANFALGQNLVSIHDIQYTTDPSGESTYKNQIVSTDGKILAKVSDGNSIGYFIQDGSGSWNGLFVWDQTGISGGFPLDVNTIWRFTGKVQEINGLTVLTNLSEFNENGTVTTPSYAQIEIGEIAEEYESVLLRFENLECISANQGEYIFSTGDSKETLKVMNFIYDPNFEVGQIYTISGSLYYIDNAFVLCPRGASDVEEYAWVKKVHQEFFSVHPNPSNGEFTISFNNIGNYDISLYDLLGNRKYKEEISGQSKHYINMKDQLNRGYYMLRIKDQNGNEITKKLLIQ